MRHHRPFLSLRMRGMLFAGAALLSALPAAAAVSSFTVVVPRKPLPQLQISRIIVTVQVDTEATIDFTVTKPVGSPEVGLSVTGPISPGMAPPHVNLYSGIVQVYPPDTAVLPSCAPLDVIAGKCDPRRRNYKFVITPTSDHDGNCAACVAVGPGCANVMGNPETWTIAVTGGASRITDACSVSFDQNIALNQCNGVERPVPHLGAVAEPIAELGGISSQEQSCRFGLDAMLVLDRSGSMGWEARPADPPGPANVRMVSLRQAVDSFVNTLTTVRAAESATLGGVPTDNVGVVIFNQDAANLPGLAAGLNAFGPATATAINTGIGPGPGGTSPGGSTSIGDGVFSADAHLGAAAANRRRVILLMSDGQQNTDRFLGAEVATRRVFTHAPGVVCPAGPGCNDLAHLGTYQIYTVTVGLGVGPAAEQLNQDVALATGGFYRNSEDDANDLIEFFGGLLQNFLETATWQTVLSGFDSAAPGTPFTVRVPITSTSQAVTVTLTPRVSGRGFCLRLRPPTGPPRPDVCGTGVLTVAATAADIGRDLGGEWEIEVEARVTPQDFHLLVLADDVGVGARVVTSSATYAPGDPVRIEAHLSEFSEPITGLDPSGLRVALASPSTTIGELLAASGAGTSLPSPDDGAIDDANAKVQNEIESNPAALAETTSGLSLRDDGTGGDR
ncbi:MAG TPA: vWA domain-containing protein, partial [Micromonosporaceae bacterium]|nr:vWA domain-containing protein [Micromonosporaceae bacterium]